MCFARHSFGVFAPVGGHTCSAATPFPVSLSRRNVSNLPGSVQRGHALPQASGGASREDREAFERSRGASRGDREAFERSPGASRGDREAFERSRRACRRAAALLGALAQGSEGITGRFEAAEEAPETDRLPRNRSSDIPGRPSHSLFPSAACHGESPTSCKPIQAFRAR
jgi:hypothetical protein